MSWNQLTFDVPDDLKDAIIGELADDVAGVWESESVLPGQTRLAVYLDIRADMQDVERRIHIIFSRSAARSAVLSRSLVEDCDWTEEWKKSYVSFPIGDDFFVIPSWENTECPEDRLPIRIDPGQAFGTGTHETTQISIEALMRWVEPDHLVLDLGTGSGILAIAARLLGVKEVFACDIDEIAVQVAQSNIERNAEDNIATFVGSVSAVRSGSVHFLLGNLTADVITRLFGEIDRVLKPAGIAVLSGLLYEQQEEMEELLRGYRYAIHEQISRGEWLALVVEKYGP